MHYMMRGQDSRNFGSLGSSYVFKLFFVVRGLSLIGFPFSLGFYSKDTILGSLLFDFSSFTSLIFFAGLLFYCFLQVTFDSCWIYKFS